MTCVLFPAPLDWKVLKNIGIDFAIIRADADSDGDSSQNYEKFAKDVKGAVENDIPYGISFVSNAKNANDAKEEAEYLVKKLKEYIPNYLDKMSLAIAYDMTDVRFKDYSTDDNTSIALAFNEVMSKNGYSVFCCSNHEVFGKINIDKLLKADVKLLYSYYPHKADLSKEIKINGRKMYLLKVKTQNGHLGGPLVDAAGEVVGINTVGITDENGKDTNCAILIDEITEMLKESGVRYALTTDVSKKGIMVNFITASVDAVLVALILISAFIRKRHPAVTETVRGKDVLKN